MAKEFSVADPILFYVEFWAEKTNIPLPDSLAAHYRRMLGRPVAQRVFREEGYNPRMLGLMPGEPQVRADAGINLDKQQTMETNL